MRAGVSYVGYQRENNEGGGQLRGLIYQTENNEMEELIAVVGYVDCP